MAAAHTEKLVTTRTEDGYLLEGAVFTPIEPNPRGNVVVWMHGFTGRFYEQHTVAIGRRLADRGHIFVTGNNRGHDFGAAIERFDGGDNLWAGGWWENVEDSRFDFAAWIRFGCELGTSGVVLIGHSLGAYKAVTYMGTCQDRSVAGLISASGPLRLWQRRVDDPHRFARAEQLVEEGRGADLLPADAGGRITSAQTLVWRAKFGLDPYGFQHPDADPPLSRIQCPILFVLGSEEPEIGRKEDLPILKRNARSARAEAVYVEGADHVYRGHEAEVADAIADWLERT